MPRGSPLSSWLARGIATGLLVAILPAAALRADEVRPAGTAPAIRAEDLKTRVRWLASDALAGRLATDPGAAMASQYVADEFRRLGLEPVGDDGGYFQGFEIPRPRLAAGNALEMRTEGATKAFAVEKDWNPFSVSPNADVTGALAFAGYAVVDPTRGYDDFAGLDAKGKVLLVLRREPWAGAPSSHATFLSKLNEAGGHGAAALLVVNDEKAGKAGDPMRHWSEPTGAALGSGRLPFAFVSRATGDALLRAAGTDLSALEARIRGAEGGPKPASSDVAGVRVRVRTAIERSTGKNARNVAGLLVGRDPALKDEVVVVGAHHDHVGLGYVGSAGGAAALGKIHPGADDNASGTAAILEIAEAMAAAPERPRRSVLFLSFSGEELGLLGSMYYVNHPLLPLAKTVAMVNCDMVGRYDPQRTLEIGGVGTGEGLEALVEAANKPYGLALSFDPEGAAPSDNTSFFMKKVPVLFFFTGIHGDYHTPRDTWDRLDYPDEAKIASLGLDVVRTLADRDVRVAYTEPPRKEGKRAALGVVPAAGSEGLGVPVESVLPGGPAEQAGIRAGDVITAIEATIVKDLRDLAKALASHKPGEKVTVKVLRNGDAQALPLVLGSR